MSYSSGCDSDGEGGGGVGGWSGGGILPFTAAWPEMKQHTSGQTNSARGEVRWVLIFTSWAPYFTRRYMCGCPELCYFLE